jgi:hypothetical protein
VKHGEELICSYFACRNAGIKFRYCSHCKVPVAKRNFRKRHKHGGEDIAMGADDSGGEDDIIPVKKGIPSQIFQMAASPEEAAEEDGISSQSADSSHHLKKKVPEVNIQQGLVRSSMQSFEAASHMKKTQNSKPNLAMARTDTGRISEDRQQRWATLLGKRPATKDGDSMSAWLMEVLAVSDLETPLKLNDEGAALLAHKKKAKQYGPERNESPRSDIYSGSSNDDSGASNHKLDDKGMSALGTFNTGIVKKKRLAELLKDEIETTNLSDSLVSGVSGSFAEWKERKKQKKQSKFNGSGPVEK